MQLRVHRQVWQSIDLFSGSLLSEVKSAEIPTVDALAVDFLLIKHMVKPLQAHIVCLNVLFSNSRYLLAQK